MTTIGTHLSETFTILFILVILQFIAGMIAILTSLCYDPLSVWLGDSLYRAICFGDMELLVVLGFIKVCEYDV